MKNINENQMSDLLRQMTKNPTTINGQLDSEVWMNKMYYDKNSGLAWKYVPGIGRNARIARLHIFKPDVGKFAGEKGFKITEYIASEDLSEVKEINMQIFHDAIKAKEAWQKLTGYNKIIESKVKITFRDLVNLIYEDA